MNTTTMRCMMVCVCLGMALGFAACGKNDGRIRASGTVEVREADLVSRVASRVIEIAADEGTSVKKGAVVARLDDRIVAAQKDTAAAMFTQIKSSYERSDNLYRTKSITREQFDLAQAQYIKAQADLRQADIMLDETIIRAPWDGVVLKKHLEVGEMASANSPVITLGDIFTAKVSIYVPLPELGKLKLGQKAAVENDTFKGKKYDGVITRIAGEAEFTPKNIQTKDERVKEVFAVEITVPNPNQELKPGMPADVEIVP